MLSEIIFPTLGWMEIKEKTYLSTTWRVFLIKPFNFMTMNIQIIAYKGKILWRELYKYYVFTE